MEAAAIAKPLLKRKKLPGIRPGDIVRVYEKVKEGNKTRTAAFEGLVIARRHGSEPGATITVRKISYGVGVERIFPLYAPTVEKFEVVRRAKVRRAKLHYIRTRVGKQATMRGELLPPSVGQEEVEEPVEMEKEDEAGKQEATETKEKVDPPLVDNPA